MDRNLTRRQVLVAAAGAGALIALPTLQKAAEADPTWVNAGTPDSFTKDTPTPVTMPDGTTAFVTKTSDTDYVAFSGKCTHRGCTIQWNGDDKLLECPCHGAAFHSDGKNAHGTRMHPEKNLPDLAVYKVRTQDGQVQVSTGS